MLSSVSSCSSLLCAANPRHRHLLPDHCFREVQYGIKSSINYADFAAGVHNQGPSSRDRTKLQLLQRGSHETVNRLLDILQHGVFDALERGFLQALQLNLLDDKERPDRVLESYTFSFNYVAGLSGSGFADLRMTSSQGQSITMKNVRHSLHACLRQLGFICGHMPCLPGQ